MQNKANLVSLRNLVSFETRILTRIATKYIDFLFTGRLTSDNIEDWSFLNRFLFELFVYISFFSLNIFRYQQYFDLEGETGIVLRGIGTSVTLIKEMDANSSFLQPSIEEHHPRFEILSFTFNWSYLVNFWN